MGEESCKSPRQRQRRVVWYGGSDLFNNYLLKVPSVMAPRRVASFVLFLRGSLAADGGTAKRD